MYADYLIILVVPRKQGNEGEHFEYDTAYAPHVHLIAIVAIGHQTFRGAVPSRRDVFSAWLLRVDASAGSEIGQLDKILLDQDVLRLYITMEDPIPVHVIDRFQQLEHVELDPCLGYVMAPPFDRIVHIHVHELEDHC